MEQTFDNAVAEYAEFMKKCGWPPRIIWVTPKDVLFTGSLRVYIRLVKHGRDDEARQTYEAGRASRLGVEFCTLCELNGAACCFVWFPRNREEATRMMMTADGSLKMSALNDSSRGKGKSVRNRFVWKFLARRYGKNGDLYGYPFGKATGFVARVIS